jgi:uroporphyrinogen decarboxylase
METALKTLDPKILLLGNIDPVNVLKMGTETEVREHTMELLYQTRNFRNFILSSGCDIPPGTPLDNLNILFSAVSEFNREQG